MERTRLQEILRKLSKKGYYEILLFVSRKEAARYSGILEYMLSNKHVKSDATVTQALNAFTDLGLLRRRISQERPIRTSYELTEKGKEFVRRLVELESLAN